MLPFVLTRFTFVRGTLMLPLVFVSVRFAFTARLVLPFTSRLVFPFALALPLTFPLAFALVFRGRLGLFSFALVLALVLRFAFVVSSSGVTVSGDSPAFVGRLMSIATVWPAFTTSPARGNWNITVSGFASLLGRVARTRNFKSASPRIFSASNRFLPTTSGTVTSGLRKER